MDCKLCGKDLKEERRRHFVCSVSTTTKIAIDSALWHEGRGYLEFFNSQADGYVCTRCMRMGEKLHKLKEDLQETQNQLRELAASIVCSMADLDSDTSLDPHLRVPALASAGASNPKRPRLEACTSKAATPVKVNVIVHVVVLICTLTPYRSQLIIPLEKKYIP